MSTLECIIGKCNEIYEYLTIQEVMQLFQSSRYFNLVNLLDNRKLNSPLYDIDLLRVTYKCFADMEKYFKDVRVLQFMFSLRYRRRLHLLYDNTALHGVTVTELSLPIIKNGDRRFNFENKKGVRLHHLHLWSRKLYAIAVPGTDDWEY